MSADGSEQSRERKPVEGVKNENREAAQRPEVPGGVYLCQASATVSCGACCGLYNCADASREALAALLSEYTETFRRVPRDAEAIAAYQIRMERRDPRPRPFYDFYHCPFLGWIGPPGSRVGCLLHPQAEGNAGIDYRGLSFYGGLACRDYFCPSHRRLPAAVKRLIQALATDWYAYGLIVTEHRMLAAFFAEVERRRGEALCAHGLLAAAGPRRAVAEFLGLKLAWPFRGAGHRGPGNYFFDDEGHPRPPIDYAALGAPPSRFDPILRELGSEFASAAALRAAEDLLEDLIHRAAAPAERPA